MKCRIHWMILALWLALGLAGGARAQVVPASRPLVSRFLDRLVSGWHTLKPHHVYLIVTAGGASTDVLAMAPPGWPPEALARSLASALRGTPLAGRPVEWESADWTAAHVRASAGRFGAAQAVNDVPVGALVAGLRRAGVRPVLVLRVPHFAFCARMPAPFFVDDVQDWYDLGGKNAPAVARVRDSVSPSDVGTLLLPFLAIFAIGAVFLALATRWARGRERTKKERSRFETISTLPVFLAWIGWMLWQGTLIGQPSPEDRVADVWFGVPSDATSGTFTLRFVAVIVAVGLTSLVAKRQAMRLYGPEGAVPAAAMSQAERAFQERSALWVGAAPLLAAVAAVALSVSHPGWLSPAVARFAYPGLLLLVSVPSIVYVQKKTQSFRQEAPDPALTDVVRRGGASYGAAPPEVVVERSARAGEFAFLENQRGGRIVVSQKLSEVAGPDEMAFLLAHQAALGRTPDSSRGALAFVLLLAVLAMHLAPGWLLRHTHVGFAGVIVLSVAVLILVLWLAFQQPRWEQGRLERADRAALAQTGDRAAAARALELLRQYGAPAKGPGNPQGQLAAQITKRLAALP